MVESEPVKGESQQFSDHCHRPKLFIKELVGKLLLQIDNQVMKSSDKLIILGVNIGES